MAFFQVFLQERKKYSHDLNQMSQSRPIQETHRSTPDNTLLPPKEWLPIPSLPIPISFLSGRYLLFSVDSVTYLRREHHICGVLIGTLPQIPQQNVFLGLPLELMPEEARILVDKGVACIVDEVKSHDLGMRALMEEDKCRYLQEIDHKGLQATLAQAEKKEQQRAEALKQLAQNNDAKPKVTQVQTATERAGNTEDDRNLLLFDTDCQTNATLASPRTSAASRIPMGITPTTSYPPLPARTSEYFMSLPDVPPSYPLFAHLHSKGYFLSPGLRFGCQYLAYPGDPLRFHSHFLVAGAEWDQEIDLMNIIVGGRLGTGVKKAFLIGGAETDDPESQNKTDREVRTFSIEWAGM